MAEKLLVPLKKLARVHEVIPCVEKISQPGMKVVFLLPFTGVHLNRCRDRRIAREVDMHTRLVAGLPSRCGWQYPETTRLPMYECSWENEKYTYEEKLFPLCQGLRQMGSEVAVSLYNRGDLRNVLRNYRLSGDRYWILMSCGVSLRLKTFLSRELSIFGLSKTFTYAPAFLLSTDLA